MEEHSIEPGAKKQAGFIWNNSTIIIEQKRRIRELYLIPHATLYVNGQRIVETCSVLKKGKHRELEEDDKSPPEAVETKGDNTGEFIDLQGTSHQIELSVEGFFDDWLPCSISIDGNVVYKGGIPKRTGWLYKFARIVFWGSIIIAFIKAIITILSEFIL